MRWTRCDAFHTHSCITDIGNCSGFCHIVCIRSPTRLCSFFIQELVCGKCHIWSIIDRRPQRMSMAFSIPIDSTAPLTFHHLDKMNPSSLLKASCTCITDGNSIKIYFHNSVLELLGLLLQNNVHCQHCCRILYVVSYYIMGKCNRIFVRRDQLTSQSAFGFMGCELVSPYESCIMQNPKVIFKGSGTLSVAKCPWKISIFGKWNTCPHPYPTLTHKVYLDRTLHQIKTSLIHYTLTG